MQRLDRLLLKTETFSNFYTEEIKEIIHYLSIHKFFKNQMLMRKGDQGSYLGIILSGQVDIVDDNVILATCYPGDLLGEMALVRSEPRSADVIAVVDGEIAILAFEDIEILRDQHPHVAVKLINVLTSSTVKKLEASKQKNTHKYIALIADDSQSKDLIKFVIKYKDVFSNYPIVATFQTAKKLLIETGVDSNMIINSQKLLGGDQGIGSLVVAGNIKAVIYFREPLFLFSQENQFGLEALSRLCDLRKIPFATNLTTAEAVIDYLEKI